MSKVYRDITKTIGNTPLVRINRLNEGPNQRSWRSLNSLILSRASKTVSVWR